MLKDKDSYRLAQANTGFGEYPHTVPSNENNLRIKQSKQIKGLPATEAT
ncbi:hypothetical protein [Peribacillus frigoritolerans]